MSDLISRSALLKEIRERAGMWKQTAEVFCKVVEGQPTVEAVPVVRCKNCKHWHKDIAWCNKHSHFIDSDGGACHPWESNDWKMFDENNFCSDGELEEQM